MGFLVPKKPNLFEFFLGTKKDKNSWKEFGFLCLFRISYLDARSESRFAKTIPNQEMLINAFVLQEAQDSSEIENIITTQDELYKALATNSKQSAQVKLVIDCQKSY